MMDRAISRSAFMRAARSHQRAWLLRTHGLESTSPKRVLLPEEVARAGGNYLPIDGILDVVRGRYKVNTSEPGLPFKRWACDALNSGHIPFNLFVPLRFLIGTSEISVFFSKLLALPIANVISIEIEYAPKEAMRLLDDNTCFDAYVEFETETGEIGSAGIEVKYTEGSYGWGTTEKSKMFDPESIYNRLTEASGIFLPNVTTKLATPKMKQMWRNQLLAECVKISKAKPSYCMFILLHPYGNRHWLNTCGYFRNLLSPTARDSVFREITYETFLSEAAGLVSTVQSVDWVKYAVERYMFEDGAK